MKSRSLFVSVFLVAAVIMGTHCGGGDKNGGGGGMTPTPTPQPTPSPSPDPLEVAKQTFATKVFPFYNHDRCVNCHAYDPNSGIFANFKPTGNVHPNVAPGGNCVSCHSTAVVGWGTVPTADKPPWAAAPALQKWVKNDDPQRLRQLSIDTKGALLYKHLVGTGADADEVVQWSFKVTPPGNPPDAVNAVPPGYIKQGNTPGGQILDADLLDWPSFKAAVDEWICKESLVPGAPDLGKPAALDCSVF